MQVYVFHLREREWLENKFGNFGKYKNSTGVIHLNLRVLFSCLSSVEHKQIIFQYFNLSLLKGKYMKFSGI